MPVEYTKKSSPTTTSVREVKDEPIDRPTVQGAAVVTSDVNPTPLPYPTDIFCALLSGEIANRGLSWYANAGPGQATRVELLKKTEQEILAHYQKESK